MQEEQLRAQEQLIVKLENEKLENDLTYKSKELASATLSVISHNDFLEGLKRKYKLNNYQEVIRNDSSISSSA